MTVASPHSFREHRRRARAEAAAWVVRLHGPYRTPALEAAFRHWLSVDGENRQQFERITEVWDDARGVPVGGMPRVALRNRPIRRWVAAAAAAAVVTCVVGALSAYGVWFSDGFQTGIGEQRIVRLDDGTRVSLNSDTHIELRMKRNQRHVTLIHGEAYFEVAHNERRPFVVSVGDHDVTALGTAFLVRFEPDSTAVTLIEGKVTVSNVDAAVSMQPTESTPAGVPRAAAGDGRVAVPRSSDTLSPATGSQSKTGVAAGLLSKWSGTQGSEDAAGSAELITLTPGERLELPRDSIPRLDSPHIDAVIAWRRGEVVLERTSLDDAIAEMNRYQDEKIVVESPTIGQFRISGIYHVGDSIGFAKTVAKLYRLHVSEESNQIHLTSTPPADTKASP